ncbi:hypothetical protein EZV62_003470 [Acer yangbiense]|uniref:CCHC-type domain-containing protein n=1 Tax=Acer yangbiense TaxID=1000413 RepID=A0A5C7IHI0_9ROSI|nr:hypothetical protein EZV62_003470 [Acer yangbiense]
MGSNDLARLCENLSIKDEDNEVRQVSEGIDRDGVEDVDHCLVGKVLSGKRVNREAFKTVIEQLWSPFGNVEIEVVGDNTFMFYFNNPEDRDRIWQRGPWHFDRSLIVLEKPEGMGDISQLCFNKAEFWVQIHDIPIMCMNKRMAKWLAEQIGRVVEIPMESRECWGKFLRVKVLIDISKPLKRWLRLKLDRSDNIVVVGLKYERLPEFCYACGKVGHGINKCTDTEAKKEAIEGPKTKFGSWLRASPTDKFKLKSSSQGSGGTSVKERSSEEGFETENRGNPMSELVTAAVQKGGSESSATATPRMGTEKSLEDRTSKGMTGDDNLDSMCVDGPSNGPDVEVGRTTQLEIGPMVVEKLKGLDPLKVGQKPTQVETDSDSPINQGEAQHSVQARPKEKGKKWKRAAREAQGKTKGGLLASPLHRKLIGGISRLKSPNSNNGSSSQSVSPTKIRNGKGKEKREGYLQPSPHNPGSPKVMSPDRRIQGNSKRKVIFELPEDERDPKRGKSSEDGSSLLISYIAAEPAEQAHREQ